MDQTLQSFASLVGKFWAKLENIVYILDPIYNPLELVVASHAMSHNLH
jgi:hypothetical protein